jgi:hypothetical protein
MGYNRHLTFLLLLALSCNTFPRTYTHPPRAGQQTLKPLSHNASLRDTSTESQQSENVDSHPPGKTRIFKQFVDKEVVESMSAENKAKTTDNSANEIVATDSTMGKPRSYEERNKGADVVVAPASKISLVGSNPENCTDVKPCITTHLDATHKDSSATNNSSTIQNPTQERISLELQTSSKPDQMQKRSFGLGRIFHKRSGRVSSNPSAMRAALMRRMGIKRVPLVDRLPFGYGKRSAADTQVFSEDRQDFPQGPVEENWFNPDVQGIMNEESDAMDKRDRLDRMAFAYGKRALNPLIEQDIDAGFLKRSRLDRMLSGYGKRANPEFDGTAQVLSEATNADKRNRLERMAFAFGRRSSQETEELDGSDDLSTDMADTDKRSRLDRMSIGYGKRRSLEDLEVSAVITEAAKRARLDRLAYGYGKRSSQEPDAQSDWTDAEKRDRLERMAFGYGKRDLDEANEATLEAESDVAKRDRLERMAFGYGKRESSRFLQQQSIEGESDTSELTKRNRLERMSFGYGKRGYFQPLSAASDERQEAMEEGVADDWKRGRLDRMAFGYGRRRLLQVTEDREDANNEEDGVDDITSGKDEEKRAKLDRMSFGYGKRLDVSLHLQNLVRDEHKEETNQQDGHEVTKAQDDLPSKRQPERFSPAPGDPDPQYSQWGENDAKRARVDRMPFAFGKRGQAARRRMDEQKRARLERMPVNFGKRAGMSTTEDAVPNKRERLERMPFTFGKRHVRDTSRALAQESGGDRKNAMEVQELEDLWKRSLAALYHIIPPKIRFLHYRPNLSPYFLEGSRGWLKRAAMLDRMPSSYGKRAPVLDRMPYSFGKRVPVLDRMPITYGKKAALLDRMPSGFGKRAVILRRNPLGRRAARLDRMPAGFGKRSTSSI